MKQEQVVSGAEGIAPCEVEEAEELVHRVESKGALAIVTKEKLKTVKDPDQGMLVSFPALVGPWDDEKPIIQWGYLYQLGEVEVERRPGAKIKMVWSKDRRPEMLAQLVEDEFESKEEWKRLMDAWNSKGGKFEERLREVLITAGATECGRPWVKKKDDKCWLEDTEGCRVLQCFFNTPEATVDDVLVRSGGLCGGMEGIYFMEAQDSKGYARIWSHDGTTRAAALRNARIAGANVRGMIRSKSGGWGVRCAGERKQRRKFGR